MHSKTFDKWQFYTIWLVFSIKYGKWAGLKFGTQCIFVVYAILYRSTVNNTWKASEIKAAKPRYLVSIREALLQPFACNNDQLVLDKINRTKGAKLIEVVPPKVMK